MFTAFRAFLSRPDSTPMFGLDARALALFRIGLGMLVFLDAVLRAPDVGAFYTDGGLLPRGDAVRLFGFLLTPSFSLHMASGSVWWQAVLLGLQGVGGLALAVGWRCRLTALWLYALVAGVQLRNLYIGAGDDALMRMLLLWSIFAPVGRAWSVDAARSPEEPLEPCRDVGSLALAAQVVLVYVATGYAKYEVEAWRTGEALWLHLQSDFHVRSFGRMLAGFPELCSALTHLTVWLELAWPLALLIPIYRGPIRTLALGAMGGLTLAFLLALSVNLFPVVASVGLLALLPAWLLDGLDLDARLSGAFARLGSRLPAGAGALEWWASVSVQGVAAGLLAWVLVWNVGVARDREYAGPSVARGVGQALFLQQGWQMFARPATRSGWVVVRGQTFGGQEVDLMRDGGRALSGGSVASLAPTSDRRVFSDGYANERWRQLLKRIAYGQAPEGASMFSRYHCREWNDERSGDDRLETLKIVFMVRPIPVPEGVGYAPELVWEHGCFR